MYIFPLILGFLLDLAIGDPQTLPHPVRHIGGLISCFEKIARKIFKPLPALELIGGTLLFISVTFISTAVPYLILKLAYKVDIRFYIILNAYFFFRLTALKSLKDESMKVYYSLTEHGSDLKKARYNLSMIVGRDTKNMSKPGIIKATVETVSENLSDGVIAPMLYFYIGGAPLCFFYKAVNTMDSMIGYKNYKYEYFGKVAARADDLLNFIPSRISAVLIILSSFILKYDHKNSFKIFIRDRYNHKSPNSAQTESATAGALNISLGGNAYYNGDLVVKPTIGDDIKKADTENIRNVNKLLYASAFFFLILLCITKALLYYF